MMIQSRFELFGVPVHLYGLILGLAMLVASGVVVRCRRWLVERGVVVGITEEMVWNAMIWVVVGGVIGARLYHVIDAWDYYVSQMWTIPAVWRGGLGIYGGLMGGLVGLILYGWRYDLSVGRLVDLGILGVPFGQAVGRWGNFVNQELYGLPTRLPWGVYIPPALRVAGYEEWSRFHPLFLYESIGMLVVGVIMLAVLRRMYALFGSGIFVATYMVGYGLVRMSLEYLRINPWQWGGVPVAVLFSGGFVLGGGLWLWRLWRKR